MKAVKRAGFEKIPAILRVTEDRELLHLALVEKWKDGNVVHLKCVGVKDGPQWLFGHTVKGHVDLSEAAVDKSQGAEWVLEK